MSPTSARIAVFAVGLVVRLCFFSGLVQTDDAHYSLAAFQLASGDGLAQSNQFGTRLGLLAPTALAYRLVGVSLWTTVWFPFFCSLAALLGIERIVRRHWGEQSALCAMALFAFLPLDVLYASRMFPCSPLALAAVILLGLLLENDGPRTTFLAGFVLGVAASFRMTALFALGPILLGSLLLDLPRRRDCPWGAAGLALAAGLEASAFWFITGDPLFRFAALAGQLDVQGAAEGLTTGFDWRFWLAPWTRLVTEQEFGFYPLVIFVGVLASFRGAGDPKERFLALFTAFIFLYTVYGTTAPWRYAPLPRLPRYLSVAAISGVILAAVWLARSLSWRWRLVVVSVLVVSSLALCTLDNGRAVAAPSRAAADYLSDVGDRRFVVEAALVRKLLFHWDYRPPAGAAFIDDGDPLTQGWLRAGFAPTTSPDDLDAEFWVGLSDSSREPQATPVARFPPPDRLYYRLLRDPLFLRFYRLVRDPYRVQGMGEVTDAVIVVVPLKRPPENEE